MHLGESACSFINLDHTDIAGFCPVYGFRSCMRTSDASVGVFSRFSSAYFRAIDSLYLFRPRTAPLARVVGIADRSPRIRKINDTPSAAEEMVSLETYSEAVMSVVALCHTLVAHPGCQASRFDWCKI
jgi:hypothetical protein